MTTISNILLDKEILLESGTNELEVLVFEVADYTFGINVAKVREILPATAITRLPRAHGSIRGVFKLRNQVIPCVSLLDYLDIKPTRPESESTLVLTDLNQQQTAFLVDDVERIYRLGWENILAVPGLMALAKTPVTALARSGQRLIVMLDFEMIIDQVSGHHIFHTGVVENPLQVPRETLRVLLADDSPSVREAMGSTLRSSGYTQLKLFENGAQAWEWIERRYRETGQVEAVGDLLISDVEMPQIDGLHLTKQIKEHPELRRLPVLLYSSIVTADNHKKGVAVGADAQVSKPELHRVVELADELIGAARRASDVAMPSSPATQPDKMGEALSAEGKQSAPDQQSSRSEKKPADVAPVLAPASAVAGGLKPSVAPATTMTDGAPSANPTFDAETTARLWAIFCDELAERAANLTTLLEASKGDRPVAEVLNDMSRTLHSIKSAAMVVPVDEVTRVTHLVESLVNDASATTAMWPRESLRHYVDWLDSIATSRHQPESSLRNGAALQAELAEALAAMAQ